MTKSIEQIYGINECLMDEDILIAYKGNFTSGMINELLINTKAVLTKYTNNVVVKKRIYNVLVECVENIYRYGKTIKTSDNQQPMVVVGKRENRFYITGGNLIPIHEIKVVQIHLDAIKKLNKDELKTKYRNTLLENLFIEQKGAGLGLIDMALKSNNLIDYHFKLIDELHAFFILEIKINDKI